MNRSILIVICDFLLLSLLTFSTDINHIADEDTSRSVKVDLVTNEVTNASRDLTEAMKQALAEERKGHEQLQQQLAQARAAAEQQQAQARQREQENARLQQQQAALQQQFAAAQTNLENLNRQLQDTSTQGRVAQEKLAATEAEAQKAAALAASLRQQLDELAQKNQLALNDKQQLAAQLQVAEAEKRAAAERAELMQQQVQAERAEKAQLAESFKALATNSSALTREIRENRMLAPNAIYSEFLTNRVQASFTASRSGFLGIGSNKDARAGMVLTTDGTNIFALCHVQDTPLTLGNPGTDWDALAGTLIGHGTPVAVRALAFHVKDPRVVMIPLSAAEAGQLGGRVYRISADPYKFQDAVIVGANSGYYGECDFQIQTDTPQYVKLDRSLLRGLVGKFNPSRGDLVFSRTGELLGIMVNSTYCLVLHDFRSAATLAFGTDVRSENTGATLARLYDYIFALPLRLQ
jgi:hypothetical protein